MATRDSTGVTTGAAEYETDVVGARAVAQIVDWIAVFVLLVVLGLLFASTNESVEPPILLFFVVAAFLYNVALEGFWNGQTLGKALTGIEVRSRAGAAPSLGQIVVRNLPALVSPGLLLYFVALLSIAMDDRKRRVFDHVADTVVVRSY